ncbi:MAG: hypothetical protein WBF93_09895 [Pirellulales bacterium]
MSGIPPSPYRGAPIGDGPFWIIILFTAAAVGAYLAFGNYVLDQVP